MSAHRRLGCSRVTGAHRLDDRRMLGQGRSRASRNQDGAVLIANRLRVQALDESDGGPVARQLEEGRVQVAVRVRRPEEIATFEELAVTGETLAETIDAGVVDALGRLANREALEHGTRLQDLDSLLV